MHLPALRTCPALPCPAVDLLPRSVTFRILWELPRGIKARVLLAAAQRKHPEPIVAGEWLGFSWAAAGSTEIRCSTRALQVPAAPSFPTTATTAGAVADPHTMGYLQLYRLLLEGAQGRLADALRLAADASNLPLMIHCIHGARAGVLLS